MAAMDDGRVVLPPRAQASGPSEEKLQEVLELWMVRQEEMWLDYRSLSTCIQKLLAGAAVEIREAVAVSLMGSESTLNRVAIKQVEMLAAKETDAVFEQALSIAIEPLKASLSRVEAALDRPSGYPIEVVKPRPPPLVSDKISGSGAGTEDLGPVFPFSADTGANDGLGDAHRNDTRRNSLNPARDETLQAIFGSGPSRKISNVIKSGEAMVAPKSHSVGCCKVCGKLTRSGESCQNCGAEVRRHTFGDQCMELWHNSGFYSRYMGESSEPERTSVIANVILNPRFESLCGLVIVLNSISIGYGSDYAISHINQPANDFILYSELFFVIFYSLEIVLKISVHRLFFLFGSEWRWNWFDLLLIFTAFYEMTISSVRQGGQTSKGGNITFIRLVRLLKLVKIFRIFRVMRFFHELRILLYSIAMSLRTLFWTVILFTLIIYIFALIFVQAVTGYLTDETHSSAVSDLLVLHWGGIAPAMTSLYKASTGGADWGEVADPLKNVPLALSGGFFTYFFVFICYIGFLYFAVLNILTGVFVESAMKTSKQDRNNIIHEERRSQQSLVTNMINLFHSFDDNNSGTINMEEFEKHQSRPEVRAYFAHLDLDVSDLWQFFKTLTDMSPKGTVEIETFVEGCTRMRGSARRSDFVTLNLETSRMFKSLEEFRKSTEDKLANMEAISLAIVGDFHQVNIAVDQLRLNMNMPVPQESLGGHGRWAPDFISF